MLYSRAVLMLLSLLGAEAFAPGASIGARPIVQRLSLLRMAADEQTLSEIQLQIDMMQKQLEVAKLREQLAGVQQSSDAAAAAAAAPAAVAAPVAPPAEVVPPVPVPVPAPVPAAEIVQQAAPAAAPEFFQPPPMPEPSVMGTAIFDSASSSIGSAASVVPALTPPPAAGSFTADDLLNLAPVFGAAFTIFPAAIILGSKLLDDSPPAPATGAAAGSATSEGASAGPKNAQEILTSGLANLKEAPLGWLFGKEPSQLYSNMPPPAPPAPPSPPPIAAPVADVTGVVAPTAAAEATELVEATEPVEAAEP